MGVFIYVYIYIQCHSRRANPAHIYYTCGITHAVPCRVKDARHVERSCAPGHPADIGGIVGIREHVGKGWFRTRASHSTHPRLVEAAEGYCLLKRYGQVPPPSALEGDASRSAKCWVEFVDAIFDESPNR